MKMAAVGSAKSTGPGQRSKSRPGALSAPLSLEEARCPVCSEILLEPVTMPCGHSVCLHCFQRTVKLISLCCPLCRLRVSSWARKQSREKSLVNAELWELVRLSHPERCKRRMEQRDGEIPDGEIFRAPVPVHKVGEMRQEYEKQKMKSGRSEETDERKKKMHIKEECVLLKHCQYPFCGVSDSENEEPVGRRTRHVSAFVRKTRCSPAFNKSCLHSSAAQRSRSCTDSEDGRGKSRGHTNQAVPEKANIAHSYNAGILLSSENSRSFSAPLLSLDKRHHWRGIHTSSATLVLQTKPERSISPESNDSISEELNHFKPIVCSPCTPPKRLPDGRLLEPMIVKSTPRNLTRALHKSTSYEASPTILQKWKQIEVDRQCIKVTSKGTVTSPIAEDLNLKLSPVEERDCQPCSCSVAKDRLLDLQCICGSNAHKSKSRKDKPIIYNKRRLIFDPYNKGEEKTQVAALIKTFGDSSTPKACKELCEPSEMGPPMLDSNAGHCNQGTVDPDHNIKINEPTTMSCVLNRPTSRRGKKRSQKTKHMEETLQTKISRTNRYDSLDDLIVQRMSQEKEDRELALKLQRQFDRECKKVDRHKTSRNKYELRSWGSKDGIVGYNTRRSGRVSKQNEHFNYTC
ncbi:E3 ubiquitin-protein ligase RNF169 [Danio rerio]|uniref:E3 ubiquitin-protein ligase RNF169 n=2 Tax=Danio rerio TaxID=7955 RepID=RN169_DANRE|nr:E3 ubiquitin-protein ligase RNF169 [Danio rerio]E7FAP1.1 RecName: Full=E3 ubiquitin-protein ligase RNF169; AltName: Full=RING finger protein 169; AltName: Full=RING-type E3 ubiquitin transferase RNF169 [Danio rerio]|eukprot:XP_001336012.2 E3 ubiquitin-protein ligase RNF169 [Danio rerio]